MAKSVSVIVTYDLDGSENAETVSFSFSGVTYEVDLAAKNRAKLEKRWHRSSRQAGGYLTAAAAAAPAVRAARQSIELPCGAGLRRQA